MDKPYFKTTLRNGVRLLLIPMKGVESIATSVMVACGSRYETPEINGVSHFLEHMVFKGTKKYPTTEDVNIIERIGGLQNAYTDIDITNYHNKTLSTDWKLALEINKELALAPRLEEKYIDKERDVILEEMKRYEDEPAAKAEETFHKMLYPGTTLGMRIIGEEASLRAANARTLRNYHDTWYLPGETVVVVAGKIPKANLLKIQYAAQEWFGDRQGQTDKSFEPVANNQIKPRFEVVTKPDAQQAHLTLGLRTFKRGYEDRYAWNVFNLLMGVGFTSRLFKEIREKRGLCYHIRSGSSNYADVGNWSIYAGVATNRVGEAVRAILEELSKAQGKGVTEDEVAVAKKRLKTILAFKSEDPEFINEYYGRQETYRDPIMTLDEYLDRIDRVTVSDVNAVVRKYFVPQTLNMALVWNKGGEEGLERLLKL